MRGDACKFSSGIADMFFAIITSRREICIFASRGEQLTDSRDLLTRLSGEN